MHPVIQEKLPDLERLCRRFRVQRLEVFGSAAGDRFDPRTSDVDFLVEFAALAPNQHFDAYFGLREALEGLFGRSVDLVMTRAMRNRYFIQSVNRTRQVVYAA
jgi:predicted nucleotidyltransferase